MHCSVASPVSQLKTPKLETRRDKIGLTFDQAVGLILSRDTDALIVSGWDTV